VSEVKVVCRRCQGSGKDPHMGGATPGRVSTIRMDACHSEHGGCGGSGFRQETLAEGEAERIVHGYLKARIDAMPHTVQILAAAILGEPTDG
jgi:hypothetical protein